METRLTRFIRPAALAAAVGTLVLVLALFVALGNTISPGLTGHHVALGDVSPFRWM